MLAYDEMSDNIREPALRILRAAQTDKTSQQYIALLAQRDADGEHATLFIGGSAFPLYRVDAFERGGNHLSQFHAPDVRNSEENRIFGLFIDTDDPDHLFACDSDSKGKPVFQFVSDFVVHARHHRYQFVLTASSDKGVHFAYTDEPELQAVLSRLVPEAQELEFNRIEKELEDKEND
ncbi:Uncharacterised protein [uncultured Butyricicoccus sp.]|jgi:hypothetical protein|nr:Uncharacterised protein [uncultured Butyricicoccus sp.]